MCYKALTCNVEILVWLCILILWKRKENEDLLWFDLPKRKNLHVLLGCISHALDPFRFRAWHQKKGERQDPSIGSSRSTLVQSNWRSQDNPTPSRPDPRDQEVNGLREQIHLLRREVQEGLNLMERSNKRIRESKEKKKGPFFFH